MHVIFVSDYIDFTASLSILGKMMDTIVGLLALIARLDAHGVLP